MLCFNDTEMVCDKYKTFRGGIKDFGSILQRKEKRRAKKLKTTHNVKTHKNWPKGWIPLTFLEVQGICLKRLCHSN